MKKNTVKAFTLVEMLIVIVIIGILIAALLPRMQAAQGRARDVSRKTALSQIQSAIVVSQGDKGAWPGMAKNNQGDDENNPALDGLNISDIQPQLEAAGLNGIPVDPLNSQLKGLGDDQTVEDAGQYRYMVLPRNGTPAGGFILMAKTEVEGGSNWVYCGDGDLGKGVITKQESVNSAGSATDLTTITPCESITKGETEDDCGRTYEGGKLGGECKYGNDSQLRYIITY